MIPMRLNIIASPYSLFSSRLIQFSILASVIVMSNTTFAIAQCGDVNGDGTLDPQDMTYIANYLCAGGPAPVASPSTDTDDHTGLNLYDAYKIGVFLSGFPNPYWDPICPPQLPALAATVDPNVKLYHTNLFPPNISHYGVTFYINTTSSFLGVVLPMRFRVGGVEAQIIDAKTERFAYSYDDTGALLPERGEFYDISADADVFTFWTLGPEGVTHVPSGYYFLFHVAIATDPAPVDRVIEVIWEKSVPAQATSPADLIFPAAYVSFVSHLSPAFVVVPTLIGDCCLGHAGDADQNGTLDIGDAVFSISAIFNDCGLGSTCPCTMSADGSPGFDIADVLKTVSYIFGADYSPPVCPQPGSCP